MNPRDETPSSTRGILGGIQDLFGRMEAVRERRSPFHRLEEALSARDLERFDGSRCLLVSPPIRPEDAPGRDLQEEFFSALRNDASGIRRELARMGIRHAVDPRDILFFDLETTGLGNSPLFLIGVLHGSDSGLETLQFFARDYSEERAVIEAFLDLAERKRILISYNGRGFDAPYVRKRAVVHGIRRSVRAFHLDLLLTARRLRRERWRHLPDCRLQTVETLVCDRRREGDIPGSQIPRAYHEFVQSRDPAEMIAVLEHNRLDLLTLADLCARLPA